MIIHNALRRDERGGILVFFIVCLPVLAGAVGFVIDLTRAQTLQSELQGVADAAALAAAKQMDFNDDALTRADLAARGLDNRPRFGSSASGDVIDSVSFFERIAPDTPASTSATALYVRVRTHAHVSTSWFSRLIGGRDSNVDAEAWAVSGAVQPGCIFALKPNGTGVTLSGGTVLNAPNCTVASNSTVTVPCGTTIRTRSVLYNSIAPPSQPCSGIVAPPGGSVSISRQSSEDPINSNPMLTEATARLTSVNALAAPTIATPATGTSFSFDWSNAATKQSQLATLGCTGTFASGKWTVTCPSGGTYNFGAVTVGGGITLDFGVNGTGTSTYNFSGLIDHSGSVANFGPGVYNLSKGLRVNGGTTTNFGGGTFNIGQMDASCSGGRYSVCHSGSRITFGGTSTFALRAGLYVTGGATLEMGSGSGNSYWFGNSTDGYAIRAGGGAFVRLYDALGPLSVSRFVGNVTIGGGSCVRMPGAEHTDIRGSLDLGGGIIMGGGVYTISGYATFGAAYGGNVTCWGSSTGIRALNSSFILGASPASSTGSCAGRAFCVGAGYSEVVMAAPTTGARLLVVGPTTGSTAGAAFIQGAANQKLSGVFYFPNGPIVLNGGASVLDGATHCLQIIGAQITLTGGTSAASACIENSSLTGGFTLVR